MSAAACIGEPISWLRLEQVARGAADERAAAHLSACAACAQCLDEIRGDAVALPPLPVVAPRAARPWLRWFAPAFGLAAAAAVLALILVRHPAPAENVAMVKGLGEVTLEAVRERAGAVAFDARTFLPADRWKLVISCPPGPTAWVDVEVDDGTAIDRPLAPARIACGNRVVLPGAFSLFGPRANKICAHVSASADGDRGSACVRVYPE